MNTQTPSCLWFERFVLKLRIKSKASYLSLESKVEVKKVMSSKRLAVGTAVVLLVFISCLAYYSIGTALQYINPVAVLAAVIVLLIGMVWFKKSIT